ncbi:hypothetical protein DH2020_033868 [Rehmannia glutinosa]|uniref:Protein kinase domain-containing protein n=1 Tax=Rehmannia glutinosa TaxID=99300 RepID=A0ABR0VAZ9_REHGL
MQSNGIRPRRFLVPQRETSKESNIRPHSTNDVKKSKEDILHGHRLRASIPQSNISGGNQECASITPPSEWGSTVKAHEENFKPCNTQEINMDFLLGVSSRLQFMVATANCLCRADVRMATGTDDLLSHMNSLALTEMEWDVGKPRDTSAAIKQDWQHHNFQGMEMDNSLSSTTYSSQPQTGGAHLGTEPAGEAEVKVDVVQPPYSLPKHDGGVLSHQSVVTSQPISSNALMPMEVNQSSGPSKEPQSIKGNATDVKSQPPASNVPPSDVKLENSKSEKLDRGGSGKAASTSRRKGLHNLCLEEDKLKGRDYATAYGFCQEIEYLNRLKGKNNIIQLIDYERSQVTDKILLQEVLNGSMSIKDGRVKDDGYIYMVLEYGEIDLAHMLAQKWKELEGSNAIIDENWLRFYWQQILLAVNTIHEERIVHSDLKPANFLLVRGSLKLIDFGIAKAIMSDTTNIQRDSQVGTLSYMSPEAFMCNETDANGNMIKCGRPSDIWSLGCILYQMVYGRTPFSEYKTFWAKLKVITDPNHEIIYEPVSNPWLLDLMKKCLAWDRNERWRIPQLLQHPFLVPPVPPKLLSPPDQKP